jgi:hypothetical protein
LWSGALEARRLGCPDASSRLLKKALAATLGA